jgi:hypothetical protein
MEIILCGLELGLFAALCIVRSVNKMHDGRPDWYKTRGKRRAGRAGR